MYVCYRLTDFVTRKPLYTVTIAQTFHIVRVFSLVRAEPWRKTFIASVDVIVSHFGSNCCVLFRAATIQLTFPSVCCIRGECMLLVHGWKVWLNYLIAFVLWPFTLSFDSLLYCGFCSVKEVLSCFCIVVKYGGGLYTQWTDICHQISVLQVIHIPILICGHPAKSKFDIF